MLILRHQRPVDQQDKVLFINGEDLMKKGRNQNTLEPEHSKALFDTYRGFTDVEGRAHVADLAEVEGNDFNLNIPLYVAPADTSEKITLADALANLEAAHERAKETRATLEAELAKWGLSA